MSELELSIKTVLLCGFIASALITGSAYALGQLNLGISVTPDLLNLWTQITQQQWVGVLLWIGGVVIFGLILLITPKIVKEISI